jgi:hypothetical protein
MKQGKYRLYAPTRLAGTKALCERLGICRSYLYMVTRGKCKPSPRLAARMRRMGLLPEAGKGGAE